MDNIGEVLAGNVRSFRKKFKLTQEGLAEKAGVSLFTVQAVESSRRWPDTSTIQKLAEAFDVAEKELFSSTSTLVKMSEVFKSLSKIPDDVYELAAQVGAGSRAWDVVRAALEHEIEEQAERKKQG